MQYFSAMPSIQSMSKSGKHIRTKSKEFLRNRTNRNASGSRAEEKKKSHHSTHTPQSQESISPRLPTPPPFTPPSRRKTPIKSRTPVAASSSEPSKLVGPSERPTFKDSVPSPPTSAPAPILKSSK
ncbi:hypothetical protein ABVK25_004680 [Lepraria finkii]|uniref:Uncharacterized protein n=1 Tax=Lepraria finkii TaxID=1340010 RepID=A0ABR4BBQ6_9LECA